MLAHDRKSVYLSFISTDLPIWSTIQTTAYLYQKDNQRFHLLLSQHPLPQLTKQPNGQKGLMWLELSPYRVIMTMQQPEEKLSYRHFWETGIYGTSRYWLNQKPPEEISSFRLRNFTRSLQLKGQPLPKSLRIEYELWSAKLQLGQYVVHLEIQD